MMRRLLLVLALALTAAPAAAQSVLVVITGIGGEPAYDARFHAWAATLMDAASERYGMPDSAVIYLAGAPDQDPGRVHARATKENVTATLTDLAGRLAPDAAVYIVIIGHGSYRNGVSKVNLPGPDLTSVEAAALVAGFGDRTVVFANLTSASGEFVAALSAPNRVIITATKSGMERNTALFGQFFVSAFVGDEADADNDGRLSMLEAFRYASQEVSRAYERENKLLSEHAVLDDNGDGAGSAEPNIDAEDGRLAALMVLSGVSRTTIAGAATADSATAGLYAEKAGVEQAIADLRRRKESLSLEEYENQLEALLVQLAGLNRALREREGS